MKNKIYIGDNLSIMQSNSFSSYKEKVKMIYIDPPYNTKNNLSYNDNLDDNEWIDSIRKRLQVAYLFLREDGLIYISIDDNKYAELKLVCDSIFSRKNFVGCFITHQSQNSNARLINVVHEYILCYAKNKDVVNDFKIKRMDIPEQKKIINDIYKETKINISSFGLEEARKKLSKIIKRYCKFYNISWLKNYCHIDESGRIYSAKDLSVPSNPREVHLPELNIHLNKLQNRGWISDKKIIELYNNGLIVFQNNKPYQKHYLEDSEDDVFSMINFYSRQGKEDLKKLGLNGLFDTPKPVELIKFLIRASSCENDIIFDFFAGSGTTAQAVYEINKEDKKNNNYILIQLDEKINQDSKPYKYAISNNIEPVISEAMLYRINTYCNINLVDANYDLIQ